MPLILALVIGALAAALGPLLARAASVLHERWPTVADLSRGLRSRTPSPSGELALAPPASSARSARLSVSFRGLRPRTPSPSGELALAPPASSARSAGLGDRSEREAVRVEQRRVVGCMVACASLFILGALHWGGTTRLVPNLLLFAVLVVVAVIDLAHSLIPNRVVFPALGLSIVATALASIAEARPTTLGWAALGAVVFCVGLLAVHLVNPAGMGFGDVKAALLLGWFLGWSASGAGDVLLRVLMALLVASVAGSVVGVVLLARRGRGASYPFGPWLALGTVAVLLTSPPGT